MKNQVDTYGATVLAPDYSATGLAVTPNGHSMYIRFL
jgi:hypothetical protein